MTNRRARPTTYNGIGMRSRLEARVAAWLDTLGISWIYEPQAFASQRGQYLPDFELLAPRGSYLAISGTRSFLEVKGDLLEANDVQTVWRQMEIVTESLVRPYLLVADEVQMERGMVFAYNWTRRADWDEVLLVDFLVRTGLVDLCDDWKLPEYGA